MPGIEQRWSIVGMGQWLTQGETVHLSVLQGSAICRGVAPLGRGDEG